MKHFLLIFLLIFSSCIQNVILDPDDDIKIATYCVLTKDSVQRLDLRHMKDITGSEYTPINDGIACLIVNEDTLFFENYGDGIWELKHTPQFGEEYHLLYTNKESNEIISAFTTFPLPHNVYPIRSFEELMFFNFVIDSNPDIGYAIDMTDGEKLKYFSEESRYWVDIYGAPWIKTFGDEFDYFLCDVDKRFGGSGKKEWYKYYREGVLPDNHIYPNIDRIYFTKLFTKKKYHLDLRTHRIFNPIYYNISPNDNYTVWIYGMDYMESSDGGRWEVASRIVTDHKLCDNFNTTSTKFKNILGQVNHYDTTLTKEFGTYNHLETLVHDRYLRVENLAGYNNGYLDHIKSIIDDPSIKFRKKYYDFYNDSIYTYKEYDETPIFPKESYFDNEYSHLFSSLFIVDGNFRTPYMYNCFKMLPDSSDVLYGGNGNTTHYYSQNSKYFLSMDANPARMQEGKFTYEPFMGIDEQYLPYQGYLCFLFVSPEYDRYLKETYKEATKPPLTDYTDIFNNKNLYTNIEGGTGIFGACYEVRKNAY